MKGRLKPKGSGTPSLPIEVFDTLNNESRVYPSISEAARGIGVNQQTISEAFKRKGESTVFIKKKRYKITKLPYTG